MPLVIATLPGIEPVDLTEVKAHLRVTQSDEDLLIDSLVKTAREMVEIKSLHAMITQTWDYYLGEFPGDDFIKLPMPPLQSVSGVYAIDTAGSEAEFSAASYFVDDKSVPGRVVLKYGQSWPSTTLQPANGVRIRFTCGFGDTGQDVPAVCIAAIKLLVSHYFEQREIVTVGSVAREVPMSVDALLQNLRMKAIEL